MFLNLTKKGKWYVTINIQQISFISETGIIMAGGDSDGSYCYSFNTIDQTDLEIRQLLTQHNLIIEPKLLKERSCF